jgi:hypothetical protein
MKRLGPTMYNHFTTLIPIPHLSQADQTLNVEVELEVKAWWTKVDNVNGYNCSLKEVKAQKGKGKLSKIERKKLNEALTFHYLKNFDDGVKVNMEMAKRLEEAQQKEAALAAELNIDVNDLDIGVSACSAMVIVPETDMTRSRRVTDFYDQRSWLQRATIIFLFLHPKIGAETSADASAFTGVKENTLLCWLYQKK